MAKTAAESGFFFKLCLSFLLGCLTVSSVDAHRRHNVVRKRQNLCTLDDYRILTQDYGTIFSEFEHSLQSRADFCPVLIRSPNWERYDKFCVKFDVAEFSVSDFAIKIFSMDGEMNWWFRLDTLNLDKERCDTVRPEGYMVSAELSPKDPKRNNHQVLLSYKYKDAESEEEDDEAEDNERGGFSLSFALTLAIVVGATIILLCCIIFLFKKLQLQKKRRSREVISDGPIVQPGLSCLSAPSQNCGDESPDSPAASTPTARLMNPEVNGGADLPPSYDSLFPTK